MHYYTLNMTFAIKQKRLLKGLCDCTLLKLKNARYNWGWQLAGSPSTAAPLLQSFQNQENKNQVIHNCVLWPDTCKRTEHDLNSQPGYSKAHHKIQHAYWWFRSGSLNSCFSESSEYYFLRFSSSCIANGFIKDIVFSIVSIIYWCVFFWGFCQLP